MPIILIVEDNYYDFAIANGIVRTEYPEASVEHIMTESSFRRWLKNDLILLPDIIILDVMLPWAEASPNIEPRPKDVANASFVDAGLRCYELLRAHPTRSHIPVIMLTVRDRFVCPPGAVCLNKAERSRLNEVIRNLIGQSGPPNNTAATKLFISYARKDKAKYKWLVELWKAIETAPGGCSIEFWDDSHLLSGEWRLQIDQHMATSKAVLFLASIEFCSSQFIRDVELPRFLELHTTRGVKVFWVAVSACSIEATPLKKFQCLNDPANPLDLLDRPHRNRTLVEIAKNLVAELNQGTSSAIGV